MQEVEDARQRGSAQSTGWQQQRVGGTQPRLARSSTEHWPYFQGAGLFELISTINHSCAPNCVIKFVSSSVATVTATRPLRPGDELLICYADAMAPVDERQRQLVAYGFTCACERCQPPPQLAAAAH